MATRDVYEKKGLPARIVTNETERTAAVFDGFQLVKTEAPKTEAPKTEAPKTEAPKPQAPKTN